MVTLWSRFPLATWVAEGAWGSVRLAPVLRAPVALVLPRSCPQLSVRAAALLAHSPSLPAAPALLPGPLLTELFYPTQVANDAWSPGRREQAVCHMRMCPCPR